VTIAPTRANRIKKANTPPAMSSSIVTIQLPRYDPPGLA
jgi:hypothetical protein